MGPRSVHRIDTASEPGTERTPLLAGTSTPTTTTTTNFNTTTTTKGTTPTYTHHVETFPAVGDEDGPTPNPEDGSDPGPDPLTRLRALLRPRVLLLAVILVFLLELGVGMAIPPTNAVMEAIICRHMHPEAFDPPITAPPTPPPSSPPPASWSVFPAHHIVLSDDPVCQGPDVQGYLAMLRGWQSTFECLPGIVGAVPYGILSDRWGRKPVLALCLLGYTLSQAFGYGVFYFSDVVPLWTMWFGTLFRLIGGGDAILSAMFYTILADVVPAEERATVFFQLAAVFLGSQMVSGPIGGAMLIWDPWLPLLVALAVLIITNIAVFALPETVHVHDWKAAREERDVVDDGLPTAAKLWQKARTGLADVWDFVLGNKSLAILILSFVFVVLGRFVGEILLQYARDRYDWDWSFASMVLTIRNAGSLVTLLAVLPAASWLCIQKLGMASTAKDLTLARWSGVVLVVGNLLIALAGNGVFFTVGLVWFSAGAGIIASVRSLLSALVEEHHVGTVNSLVGFMEMVGLTMAGPVLAKSLSVGLNHGGWWIGLPFFIGALFFSISTAILFTFRIPNGRQTSLEPA